MPRARTCRVIGYLTEIPTTLAEVLIGLIGQEVAPIANSATNVKPVAADDLDSWERKIEQGVAADPSIPETDRLAIIRARKGQGLFKERVGKIEIKCRITGVENPAHLVASHCKPWRDSTNEERLDGENGLLLTPSVALVATSRSFTDANSSFNLLRKKNSSKAKVGPGKTPDFVILDLSSADSDEVARAFRDDAAHGFRHDVARGACVVGC